MKLDLVLEGAGQAKTAKRRDGTGQWSLARVDHPFGATGYIVLF